jgi:hypothetical protein
MTAENELFLFVVTTALGDRTWMAEDEDHAREQHDDAFPDEIILAVRNADPDNALALLRAYVALCLDADANNRPRPYAEAAFPEQFDALDKWLSSGGYLPRAWADAPGDRDLYETRRQGAEQGADVMWDDGSRHENT